MKCIIIEDEIPAQRILQRYVAKIPDLELIACFQSALQANGILQDSAVDLIFLDINLPDISGIQYLKTLSNPPYVIMTTAYPEHAVASFELDTICDYLVKPFSFDRFLKAVNKTKKRFEPHTIKAVEEREDHDTIFLNIDKTLHKIAIRDIIYIESDKNYVTVATDSNKYSYLDSLKSWKSKLPENQFLQVHKSYIINSEAIDRIQGNLVFLGNRKIPVGRVYKSALFKMLKLT